MKNAIFICAVCLYLLAAGLFIYSMFSDKQTLFMCFGAASLCLGSALTIYGTKKK